MIRSICVFCGASQGNSSGFMQLAFDVGQFLALANIRVVYGGASIGLMGALADGALSCNGEVIGVLPEFLANKEIAHPRLSQLILTDTMHNRKMQMHHLSDASIALPGGFGTLDELFELLTWRQLGLHHKPIGILNYKGFYNHLIELIDSIKEHQFISAEHLKIMEVESDIESLIQQLQQKTSSIHLPG